MMHETDLPCPERGAEFEERQMHARDPSVRTGWRRDVTVVERPHRGARYYPGQTGTRLGRSTTGAGRRSDSRR